MIIVYIEFYFKEQDLGFKNGRQDFNKKNFAF